ncbi:PadR family transcriptional regulator [candidate division CSSED10-310 bacterium]|uniref:PadR family transcriptional regulator n=1 Tax=candidate division CSSED10-310 bacterium TaxID=2855610 RepID=A0ABV6YTP8_UNCC1
MNDLLMSEAALLGLLTEETMHPYQIEKVVRERCMREWTELSQAAIYKLLNRMEKAGLVKKDRTVTKENRIRNTYSITKAGRAALKQKVEVVLSEPEHIRWRLDVAIYYSNSLTPKKRNDCLRTYRQNLEKRINYFKETYDYMDSIECSEHRKEIALRPVYLLEAEVKWVDAVLKKWRKEGEHG